MPVTAADLEDEYQEEQERKAKVNANAKHLLHESFSMAQTCPLVLLGGLTCAIFLFMLPLPHVSGPLEDLVTSARLNARDAQPLAQESKVVSDPPSPPTIIGGGRRGSGRLHVIIYATHGGRDDRFCRGIESSIRNGVDLTILGWGLKWHGLAQKLSAAYDYAKNLPGEDLLLFADGHDVLYLNSTANILKSYFDMMHSTGHKAGEPRPIVFSAECGCWPLVMTNREACFNAANGGYPESPTPYRYLNSGTYLGGSAEVSKMLLAIITESGDNFIKTNDQQMVFEFYAAGRHGIKLDFYSRIFQCMHMTLDPPMPLCNPIKDLKQDGHGNWFNARTDSYPALFHFNGGGKKVYFNIESNTWYRKPSYNTEEERLKLGSHEIAVTTAPTGKMRFDEICRSYIFPGSS